jgi:hypothetical protein
MLFCAIWHMALLQFAHLDTLKRAGYAVQLLQVAEAPCMRTLCTPTATRCIEGLLLLLAGVRLARLG